MSKWEDIVKDKLENYGSKLPEGSLAEFRTLRAGAGSTRPKRRSLMVWAAAAVAAGLAAVLLLRPTGDSGESVRKVLPPVLPAVVSPAVAAAGDSTTIEASLPAQPLLAKAVVSKAARRPIAVDQAEETPEPANVQEPEMPQQTDAAESTAPQEQETVEPGPSTPFPSESVDPLRYPEPREVRLSVAPVAGAIAGGGLLAAIAVPLLKGSLYDGAGPSAQSNHLDTSPIPYIGAEERPREGWITHAAHRFPLKAGLSLRFPVTERLNLTTGLEYSLYRSEITYETSGLKRQAAHYLGVPVRLDWTLASGRWLDAYVGAGVSGDKCVAAYQDGKPVARDAFAFSLLGAGGVQLNVSKRLGLYVEPEVSWVVPWQPRMLHTYRSGNPVMFSVATGLRIHLGK